MVVSYPRKQAALAGKARIIMGTKPRYRAVMPSFLTSSLNTDFDPRMVPEYDPVGAT